MLIFKSKLDEAGVECELLNLESYLEGEDAKEAFPASVLIIRNGVSFFVDNDLRELWSELTSFEWDKRYWDTRRKKVLNKHARYNVCFGDESQEPDYENKKGNIVGFERVKILKKMRENLGTILGKSASDLEVEGNYYYDNKKCGIGFHGDSERKKVIAASLGASRPINWQWYQNSKPIGERIKIQLNHGDMYIMSEKASGWDWKYRSKKTLRHAAGEKYVV